MPGNAALFTGVSGQYLKAPAPSATIDRAYTDPLMIHGWVLFFVDTYYVICGRPYPPYYIYRDPSTKKISAGIYDSTNGSAGTNFTLKASAATSVGLWYHWHLQYDPGTKVVTLWVNNDDATKATATLTNGVSLDLQPAAVPLVFSSNAFTFNWLNGRVDDVGYSRTAILTSGERATVYNAGAGTAWASLGGTLQAKYGAWWSMDETSGSRLDSTGNGNHLTEVGGTLGYGAGVIVTPFAPATIALVTANPSAITFTGTVTGGVSSVTARLKRLRYPSDLLTTGTTVATAAGTSPYTLIDAEVPDSEIVYHYFVEFTDSNSTPQVAYTAIRPASLWKAKLGFVKAGDSIDAMASVGVISDDTLSGRDAEVLRHLKSLIGPREIIFDSQSVPSMYTSDFAPSHVDPISGLTIADGQRWTSFKAAFDAMVALVGADNTWVIYKLGTNDGNSAYTASVGANFTAFRNYVLRAGARMIVNYPPYSSAAAETGFQEAWQAFIDTQVDNLTIFHGMTNDFKTTANRWPTIYSDGITHFTSTGATVLSAAEAMAIAGAVEPVVSDADQIAVAVWNYATRTISGPAYVTIAPGYTNGSITIRKGDSYGSTSGQRLTITQPTGANWPSDLASLPWSVTFTATKIDTGDGTATATIGPIACTINSATSINVPLTAAQTALALHTKPTDDVFGWQWDLQAATSTPTPTPTQLRNTLISGLMTVLDEVTTG